MWAWPIDAGGERHESAPGQQEREYPCYLKNDIPRCPCGATFADTDVNGRRGQDPFRPERGSYMGRRRGFLLGVLLLGIVLALGVYFSRQLLYLAR